MNLQKLSFSLILLLLSHLSLNAQNVNIGEALGDESEFYASTKQVNQFLRRFNAEETIEGKRLYEKDKDFRDLDLRLKYLPMLFDAQNRNISSDLKQDFVSEVATDGTPQYLDFHGGDWFAEVQASFIYKGQEKDLTLFMKLEEEKVGSKWVMSNMYFEPFYEIFYDVDTTAKGIKFLHPMSHELDFMNLVKVFRNKDNVPLFTEKEYRPDFLTLFLYEVKKGNLQFSSVNEVKFHFFQIDDWYFEISEFNRPGYNTGWLISNLVKVPEEQKDILQKYIYREE